MKSVERFFRKYFLSMAGIIALFLLLNVVLLFSVLIWTWQTSTSETPDLSVNEICDGIMTDGEGHFTMAEGLSGLLEENHAWAMILDDAGAVVFPSGLPGELPRRYTTTDVA